MSDISPPGTRKVRIGNHTTTPEPTRWLNPLNKIKWRKAIIARQTTFMLDDNRAFTLDYKRVKGKVLIRPVKGFTPMCWLDVKRVEQQDGDWIVSD